MQFDFDAGCGAECLILAQCEMHISYSVVPGGRGRGGSDVGNDEGDDDDELNNFTQ